MFWPLSKVHIIYLPTNMAIEHLTRSLCRTMAVAKLVHIAMTWLAWPTISISTRFGISSWCPVEWRKVLQNLWYVKNAIAYIRQEMQCTDDDYLIICVDEIVELGMRNQQLNDRVAMTIAQRMMSDCMGLQDGSEGKIICIFTAILESMSAGLLSSSGRKVQCCYWK